MTQCEQKKILSELLSQLENRHSQEIQLGLTRIKEVAARLDLLHPSCPVITVGGTNGKGSTVALLESIYTEAGYSVGSYTSPHLLAFNERIHVNKKPISDLDLIIALKSIEEGRGAVHLTYFEIATLAALWHFRQQKLDVIILEVGLGGRLDATNLIDTNLAIITTVDKDHEDFLGDTVEKIGYEKAGILRKETPCIYADYTPPLTVINHAANLEVPLYFNGRDYSYKETTHVFHFILNNQSFDFPLTHFHNNAVAASLMAAFCLQDKLPLNYFHCQQGLENATLKGRLQWVEGPIRTLIDVAHNPQSARYLATHLTECKPTGRIHAVFSVLADKDIPEIISPLKPIVNQWYPALLDNKRAATSKQLLTSLKEHDVNCELCYNDPVLAYQAACDNASSGDLIVVFGSFFMASAILSFLDNSLYSKEIL